MNKMKYALSVLAACLFIMTCATESQAVFRTFVAGPTIGNDSNTATNCAFSTPCRNLAAAYGITDVGGEIVALSSAGYGGVVITHALTVQAAPGQYAFFAAGPGGAAIVVSAGASEQVTLRGLQFSGAPPLAAGSIGVQHTSGKLLIENCVFTALATGIQVNNAREDVVACDILNNTIGISTTGNGADQSCLGSGANGQAQWPGDAAAVVRVDRGSLSNNGIGFQMNNPGLRHANCFCTPVCPFPTPTPSIVPTDNLITVFLHSTDNSSAGITLNITGNTTFLTGTGASCTATPGMCASTGSYSGTTNPH